MAGDGDGFNQRGVEQGQIIGQRVQGVRRHRPEALHGAGGVDADELEFGADVGVAAPAGGADAAGRERPDGNAVAGRPAVDAGADGGDGARTFVADHLRELDPVVHVAVEQMEVGTADPAMGDLDLDLARGGGDGGAGSDGDCPVT